MAASSYLKAKKNLEANKVECHFNLSRAKETLPSIFALRFVCTAHLSFYSSKNAMNVVQNIVLLQKKNGRKYTLV